MNKFLLLRHKSRHWLNLFFSQCLPNNFQLALDNLQHFDNNNMLRILHILYYFKFDYQCIRFYIVLQDNLFYDILQYNLCQLRPQHHIALNFENINKRFHLYIIPLQHHLPYKDLCYNHNFHKLQNLKVWNQDNKNKCHHRYKYCNFDCSLQPQHRQYQHNLQLFVDFWNSSPQSSHLAQHKHKQQHIALHLQVLLLTTLTNQQHNYFAHFNQQQLLHYLNHLIFLFLSNPQQRQFHY